MRIIAYTALHYGADYLPYAIRAVIDHVQEWHILYSAQGSHGHKTPVTCPESRVQLKQLADDAAGDKLRWVDGAWSHEGQQRDSIHGYAPDADMVINVDYDEIWTLDGLQHAIQQAIDGDVREYRVPMVHFWRSFHRCILHDPAYPVRILMPKRESGSDTLRVRPVAHMGYAIKPDMMRYKWLIHGHKNEQRTDVNWFDDVYMTNRQTDCHPVGSDAWNAEIVHPLAYLPDFMIDHPFYDMKVIE